MEASSVPAPRAAARPSSGKADSGPKTPWWLWLAVAGIVVFCLFPFYWMLNISLKTGPDLSAADFFPPHPTLKNYKSIFQNGDFTAGLRNSAIVALTTTFLSLIVGSFAAYALARLKVRGKFWILAIVLSVSTFPGIAIAAPLFKLWTDIHL